MGDSSKLLAATAADYKPQPVTGMRFAQGFVGQRYPGGDSPRQGAPVAPMHPQTLAPAGYVSITWFGKRHYISLPLFEKDADKYHELHWKEAFLVLDSIESNKAIFDEWAHPSDFFGAVTSDVVYLYDEARQKVKSWVSDIEKAKKPDLAEFDKLIDRAYVIIERLAQESKSKLEADKMARNGLELEQLWQDSKALVAATQKFRDNAIESAEQVTAGLETVESTAFQLLNLVPTITFMDPIRECVYKIGVLLLRASARGVGGYTAWGTTDAAVREAFGVLMREGPGVIVDVVLGPVSRLFNSLGLGTWTKRAATICVQQVLEFTCWFCKTCIENGDKEISDKQWEDMLYDRVYSLIGAVLGEMFGTNLGTKARDLLIKAVAENLIRELVITAVQCRRIAKEQSREYVDVLMGELPGMIMRIFQGAVVGTIQRRAQQSGQFIEQQRATRGEGGDFGGTNFHEAATILDETHVGEFARKGTPSKETLRQIQRERVQNPASQFTYRKFNGEGWRDCGLDYGSAQTERRYADDNNVVVIMMDPAQTRRLHTDTPEARGATGPKPMGVKAKSSNNANAPLEVQGLVVKPIREGQPGGPTHNDYDAALRTWKKEEAGLFKGGFMVNPKGVVFHPDQLERWAQLHPEDRALCDAAIKTLKEASQGGYHDLTEMPGPNAKLSSDLAARLEDENFRDLLGRAKVGYYSDLDLVEVVDFGSGKRRFMGDLGEKKEILQLARDNRDHMNSALNIHDYDDPDLPPDVHLLARQGDAVQHGGNNETVTLTASKKADNIIVYLDKLHMVFPGGELIHLNEAEMKRRGYSYEGLDADAKKKRLDQDIRSEIEKELKKRLGDKYQDFANRAESVRKSYSKKSPRYKVKGKKPEPVTTEQLETIGQLFAGAEVLDEPGLGSEIPHLDVINSLHCRGLSIRAERIVKVCGPGHPSPSELEFAMHRYNTAIGAEVYDDENGITAGQNLVIAVSHYRQTIPEALESLMRTRMALGNIIGDIKVWYEIYTAYRPFTSDWVRDRIGGPKADVTPAVADLRNAVSSFNPRKDERLYAFCVTGFEDTYKKTRQGKIKDPRPIQGLVLTDVWENTVTKDHDYRPTQLSGDCKVMMLTHALLAVPAQAADSAKAAAIAAAKEKARARTAAMAGAP